MSDTGPRRDAPGRAGGPAAPVSGPGPAAGAARSVPFPSGTGPHLAAARGGPADPPRPRRGGAGAPRPHVARGAGPGRGGGAAADPAGALVPRSASAPHRLGPPARARARARLPRRRAPKLPGCTTRAVTCPGGANRRSRDVSVQQLRGCGAARGVRAVRHGQAPQRREGGGAAPWTSRASCGDAVCR